MFEPQMQAMGKQCAICVLCCLVNPIAALGGLAIFQ